MNQSNYPMPAMAPSGQWSGELTTPAYPVQSPLHGPSVPSPTGTPRLHMAHGQTAAVIQDPQDRDEVYMGSLKAMLMNNVGNHIIASFLAGSQNLVRWEGVLYDVGNNYVTIYQEDKGRYVVGDLYALKFMEFYEPKPRTVLSPIPQPSGWQGGI